MRLDAQRDAPRRLCQCRPPRRRTALADWHTWAGAYDIAETNRLARTLRSWEPELLAYFDSRLTNGPTEGTNRVIKAVKRQGFGYTSPRTTGCASSTAAHDTLNPPDNRTPAAPQNAESRNTYSLTHIVDSA